MFRRYDALPIQQRRIMSNKDQPKSSRIALRVTPAEKRLLQDAARVSHKSVTAFLLDAGIEAANPLHADQLRFTLPPNEWEEFQAMLEQPVQCLPALVKLLREPGLLG